MSIQSQLIMIAWIPVVLYLFNRFKAQEAVIISFIVAWLFLPQRASFSFPGLPDYERMSATVFGILLATIIYDIQRLKRFNFKWIDIPMLVWCICPVFSSVTNGLGVYDGIAESLSQTVAYGGPYFLGRIYFSDLAGFRKLAMGIFLGGIIYIPLCLYEIRMSPQLHKMLYGYHPHPSFYQTIRYGGYRPTVFMQHGLAVGMWMMAATLIGIWFWKTGVVQQIYGIHVRWLVGLLLITFVLLKSTGAYGLLFVGIMLLFLAWQFHTSVAFVLIIFSMIFYLQQNVYADSNLTDRIVTTLSVVAPEDRIQSLEYRFDNEELLKQKAQQKMLFGWGGWGRSRIFDYDSRGNFVDVSTTDSLWIITFGKNGIVGLFALFGSILIPVLSFCLLCFPAKTWSNRQVASAAVIVVIVTLYMLDSMLNNLPNPVFTLAAGGISSLVIKEAKL